MASKSSIIFSFLIAHLLLIAEVASQAYTQNITQSGPTLSTSGPYSYMTSPAGDFAFGFQPYASNSLFLIAIWFNKTSCTQPIIWFAKNYSDRGAPILAPVGSKLGLAQTGDLIMTGPNSEEIWSIGLGGATHLTLLNEGNLILYNDSEMALWQSFDSPTDTLVPGQTLNKGSALLSKFNDSDFSPGRFELAAQMEGYLALNINLQPPDPTSTPYWRTQIGYNSGVSLVFNQSGFLYYELTMSSSPFIISQYPSTRYYQHATIDPDGVFRVYVYDKNLIDKGNWSVVSELPEDACYSTRVDVGSGICGFNAYCTQSSNVPRLNCSCPQKYTFFDAGRPYLGCRPDFALQNCSVDETANFKFVEMKNTDWLAAGDYVHFVTEDEGECMTSCLNDCFCSVAIYRGIDCWKKKFPLSNGRQTTNTGGKAFIKVRAATL